MARKRRRRPARAIRKKRQDLFGILIGVGCILLLAALAAGIYQITRTRIALDESYCPETGPVNVTVVLVDRTDRLSSVQQASVRKNLEDLRASIPTHGLLEVYSVGSTDEGLLTAEFRLCNPGRGEEVSEWIDNPPRAERRWKEFFAGPLQDVFDRMVNSGEAAKSPIMESIQSVALSAFAGQALQDTPKQLIIVSDMLQHTNGLSHYRDPIEFEAFRQSPYYRKVRADLGGAHVKIFYVWRDNAAGLQGRTHAAFWEQYFSAQGAILEEVTSIQG